MVDIDPRSVSLLQPVVAAGRPHIDLHDRDWITCQSPTQRLRPQGWPATQPFDTDPLAIAALGRADLVGDPSDPIVGWRLGWIQLQFIEDNFARYRALTEREGSASVSWSHLELCRDNDTRVGGGTADVPPTQRSPYYDHPN